MNVIARSACVKQTRLVVLQDAANVCEEFRLNLGRNQLLAVLG